MRGVHLFQIFLFGFPKPVEESDMAMMRPPNEHTTLVRGFSSSLTVRVVVDIAHTQVIVIPPPRSTAAWICFVLGLLLEVFYIVHFAALVWWMSDQSSACKCPHFSLADAFCYTLPLTSANPYNTRIRHGNAISHYAIDRISPHDQFDLNDHHSRLSKQTP